MPSVDWYEGTIKGMSEQEVMALVSAGDGVWEAGRGYLGYSVGHRCGGICVLSGGRANMGVHVQVQGQGCAEVERSVRWASFQEFCRELEVAEFRPTRVDVAFDERQGIASVNKICAAIKAGSYTSKWQDSEFIESFKAREYAGLSVYLGDKSSDNYACIYDKRAERLRAGDVLGGPWVRYELRYKRAQAQEVARNITARGVGAYMGGWLASSLEFKVPALDSHKDRWPRAAWWGRVLEGIEPERLKVPERGVSLGSSLDAFVRANGRTYATLALAAKECGYDGDLGARLLAAGIEGMGAKHTKRLAALIQDGRRSGRGVAQERRGAEE